MYVASGLTGHLCGTVERGHISHLVPYSSECMHGGGVVPVLHIFLDEIQEMVSILLLYVHRNQSFKY